MPLHIGPLGQMTQLPPPLEGVPVERPRTGGTHTALSGATTVDYLGSAGSFEFRWTWMDGFEVEYLEALHDRHVPGPLRFVLPGYRYNRVSRGAASVGYGGRDLRRVQVTAGDLSSSSLWPSGAAPAGSGLSWSGWSAGDAVRFDRSAPAPVLSGETVTGSVYVRSTHADSLYLTLDHYVDGAYSGSTQGTETTLTADTWTRLEVPTSADVWAVSPAVVTTVKANADSTITLAAAQVEPGSTATGWKLGGASPVCAVDAKPATWPRKGLSHHTLTLLEL